HGLEPSLLQVELTEGAVFERRDARNPDASQDAVASLRELGVRIAIDDFGVGYSSLSYLKRWRGDAAQLDRRFVRGLVSDSTDLADARGGGSHRQRGSVPRTAGLRRKARAAPPPPAPRLFGTCENGPCRAAPRAPHGLTGKRTSNARMRCSWFAPVRSATTRRPPPPTPSSVRRTRATPPRRAPRRVRSSSASPRRSGAKASASAPWTTHRTRPSWMRCSPTTG